MWDKKVLYSVVFFCFLLTLGQAQKKLYTQHIVAFYNAENLFDTIKNPKKFDDEYTPLGEKRWNSHKYRQKVENLAKAIRLIGADEGQSPTLIGLCEVENRQVIEDLIHSEQLRDLEYEIIHYESPDSRGIDVAFLYQKHYFLPTSTSKHHLVLFDTDGQRIYTRDQLLVTGKLDQEEIHLLVNHWPSRYSGEKRSQPRRIAAAQLNRKIIDSLIAINPNAKIITMGDFNDGPADISILKELHAVGKPDEVPLLFNPMFFLSEEKGLGTLAYNDKWELFDQIIVSKALINKEYSGFQLRQAHIFNPPFLRQNKGKYKGYPQRNTINEAGYSDHFPVYITLVREVDQ